jgi:alginate O-acetyltransferase complex protein AlgI
VLFNSHAFLLLFLPLVLVLHDYFGRQRAGIRQGILLLASLAFYAYWSLPYLGLLLLSVAFNFGIAQRMLQAKGKSRPWLWFGLCGNLATLGLFKYFDFAIENLNAVLGSNYGLHHWVLPLGISFYTFQQISFLMDIDQGRLKQFNGLTYACYVCFFPQLIAGPIVRYMDVEQDLQSRWDFSKNGLWRCQGIFLLGIGLCKKLFIADSIAPYVDTWHQALSAGHQPAMLEAWLMAVAYPFQLYFDFSGYSDMAVGLGMMFGVRIPFNFNAPFLARNISDFWKRWHISLSECFQRYFFTPLAMSLRHQRLKWARESLPFLLTMTMIGLWHGAGWNYVIWGFIHGVYLVLAYTWKSSKLRKRHPLPRLLSWAITFLAVVFVFVWFRSENIDSALRLIKGLFGGYGIVIPMGILNTGEGWLRSSYYLFPALFRYRTWDPILPCFVAAILIFCCPTSQKWCEKFKPNLVTLILTAIMLLFSILKINEVSVFLYYQF